MLLKITKLAIITGCLVFVWQVFRETPPAARYPVTAVYLLIAINSWDGKEAGWHEESPGALLAFTIVWVMGIPIMYFGIPRLMHEFGLSFEGRAVPVPPVNLTETLVVLLLVGVFLFFTWLPFLLMRSAELAFGLFGRKQQDPVT